MYSPVHTLISILLIYSVTDALNVYMYVMYLVFETFHMQELYLTTLYRLHSSELSRGVRLCQREANAPPRPPLNEALNYIPARKQQSCISMLCNNFPIVLQVTLQPQKQSLQSHKNGLGRPQNDLGGCRDQVYHFQHQKLPLYAQSREPFHTGHGRPFQTNTQTISSLLY